MKTVVKVICQAEEKYQELLVTQQHKESRLLLKKFSFLQECIKRDFAYGEVIKKEVLRKNKDLLNSFFRQYQYPDLIELDNCFCCDLTRTNWRMVYTIVRDAADDTRYILYFMIVDHQTYEKYFT